MRDRKTDETNNEGKNHVKTEFREKIKNQYMNIHCTRAAVVHFILRAGSTFPVPVCTAPHRHWFNKAENQQD